MNHILTLIQVYSALYGFDPMLVRAMVAKESAYDPGAIGEAGEIGLLQLLPSTVDLSEKDLKDPETNIRAGLAYLSRMRKECKYKDNNLYINCFNLGPVGGGKLKHPEAWQYYKDVMTIYYSEKNKWH